MRRFFIEPEAIADQKVTITGDLVHHLSHVLRLKVGTEVSLCTGDGQIYGVRLLDFGLEIILGEVLSVTQVSSETQVAVTLIQGMPKGDKLELIIQKCTELGVDRIVPVFMARSVVKLDEMKSAKKQERWQKIADQASQQAKRVMVPEIVAPMSWRQALEGIGEDALTLVMWEDEVATGLKKLLSSVDIPKTVNLIIGPEGGLTDQEVEELTKRGAYSVTLGKRILRTETAGMVALAMVLYHTGDLG